MQTTCVSLWPMHESRCFMLLGVKYLFCFVSGRDPLFSSSMALIVRAVIRNMSPVWWYIYMLWLIKDQPYFSLNIILTESVWSRNPKLHWNEYLHNKLDIILRESHWPSSRTGHSKSGQNNTCVISISIYYWYPFQFPRALVQISMPYVSTET